MGKLQVVNGWRGIEMSESLEWVLEVKILKSAYLELWYLTRQEVYLQDKASANQPYVLCFPCALHLPAQSQTEVNYSFQHGCQRKHRLK